jgi:phage tail protein X
VPSGLTATRVLRGARHRISALDGRRAAVAQARDFARTASGPIRACWDLDNTLVDSGRLLRAGVELDEAVRTATPLAGMLEFHRALRAALPSADHFMLSARPAAMRADTLDWLCKHGFDVAPGALGLVPIPDAKPAVWRRLARGARLLVVDDLMWNHESDVPQPYRRLVKRAGQIADCYVGADTIAEIARDPERAGPIASHVAAELIAEAR